MFLDKHGTVPQNYMTSHEDTVTYKLNVKSAQRKGTSFAMERLCRNVSAATNTHATDLLCEACTDREIVQI
jgi:hypothetical protein